MSFRHDPMTTKFIKYKFAVLHSSFLYYCAECTVALALQSYSTLTGKKTPKEKAITVVRAVPAQVYGGMSLNGDRVFYSVKLFVTNGMKPFQMTHFCGCLIRRCVVLSNGSWLPLVQAWGR